MHRQKIITIISFKILHNMPKGKTSYCECGCGVTPTTYRRKFFEKWANGYPCDDSGLYYCSRYGQTNNKGYTCQTVVSEPSKLIHVDHIWPKAEGGSDCIDNLRVMCVHCNTSKNDTITHTAKCYQGKDSKQIASAIKRKIKK
jgi:hypothetical protein